jgi:hypothetical protein
MSAVRCIVARYRTRQPLEAASRRPRGRMCPAEFDRTRTRVMNEKLAIGDTFPSLRLTLVDGRTLTVPGDLTTKYKVILFYRGHW